MALHLNLGNARMACGDHAKALAAFDRACALSPDFAFAHNNRGNALRNLQRLEEAIAAYNRASMLAPDLAEVYINKGNVCMTAGRLADALACFQAAIRLEGCSAMGYSSALFAFHYDSTLAADELTRLHRKWGERYGAVPRAAHRNVIDPERRLRIGYVSADFRRHPIAMFTAPVLAAHNRSDVEVFAYSNNSAADDWTAQVRSGCDHWQSVAGWSDIELQERIQADAIDILIDLSGHTAGNRLLTFARRPAPVQVTWLGYFNTTGLDAIDYILIDPVLATAPSSYAEAPYTLDGCYLCYQVPAYAQPATQTPAQARGYTTYGCFNALAKITREVVRLWARILVANPVARLVLRNAGLSDPAARARYRALFEASGVCPSRIDLLGECSHRDLLAAYAEIDIALDPFPYNGGTTTCEALSMGVPVVTLAGDRFVSRVGCTILRAAGHPEWIASDPEDYISIALALRQQVASLRPGLASQIAQSPLASAGAFAAKLEMAYRSMWRKWCDTR
jgi:predicted O-linked N-acetylglucosamine transferase (SPINDLY family)